MKKYILLSKLNELLQKNVDTERCLIKATERATDELLQNFFARKSKRHSHFADDLREAIESYGGHVDHGGSLVGASKLIWMDAKAMFTSDNDQVMLEAVLKGETSALKDYVNTLKIHGIPEGTEKLLQNQKDEIAATLSTIKKLEDLTNYSEELPL